MIRNLIFLFFIWTVIVLKVCLAFSGDGPVELIDEEIVEKIHEKSINNDYKELTTIVDPFWLANLWPQVWNGVHLSLRTSCLEDLTIFFQAVLDGKFWALHAIDSTGQITNGMFWGNTHWIGSKDQCENLNENFQSDTEDYNDSQAFDNFLDPEDSFAPYRMSYSVLQVMFNITKLSHKFSSKLHLGQCYPSSCSSRDIYHLVDFSLYTYQTLKVIGTLPRSLKVLDVRLLEEGYALHADPFFYALCCIIAFVSLLIISGTIIETRDDSLATIDEDEVLKPKFRQLTKSDISEPIIFIQDSSKCTMNNYNNNSMTIDNNTNDFIFGSPKKSMESIFTVDGLIQNKFSDGFSSIRNENFFNMQKFSINIFNEQENLKAKKCKRKLQSSLKKRKISTDNGAMISDHRCKKQKYVLSMEEPTLINQYIDDFRSNLECFGEVKCIDKNSNLAEILMCFSLRKNLKDLFSIEIFEDNLSCVHGVKVLCLLWMTFIQTVFGLYNFSDNKSYIQNYVHQLALHSTYAIDTFFVVSGILSSYTINKFLESTTLEECNGLEAILKGFHCFVDTFTRRYLRYICPYVLVLCLNELLSNYIFSNDILEPMDEDHVTCSGLWWRNILYINTFYSHRDMCMPFSWFLSIDTQFYVAAIMIIVLSTKCPKISTMITSMILLATWSAGALITLRSHDNTDSFLDFSSTFESVVYMKPWVRVGPYITGLAVGWILNKSSCCLLISKPTSFTLWLFTLLVYVSTTVGLYGLSPNHQTTAQDSSLVYYISVAYTVMGDTAWGLSVAWTLLACVTGYGGILKHMLSVCYALPLSRLCYSMYLMHPLVCKIIFISAQTVQHFTSTSLMVYYVASFILTFVSATLVSLLLESPMIALLKLSRPQDKPSSRDGS